MQAQGSGHRGPPPAIVSSNGSAVGGETGQPPHPGCAHLLPPAEKDPIQAIVCPADGSFPITPQRQQPRVPLSRESTAPNRAPSPAGEGWGEGGRAAVFILSPLFS